MILISVATIGALAPVSHACNAFRRGHADARLTEERRAPWIIGDSTMIFAAPLLGRRGLRADARGCRQFSAGVAMLQSRRRGRTLPRLSILALGANGAVSRRAVAHALAVVGRHRILGLVTPRQSAGTVVNMRWAARRHPDRVLLIDWARHSGGRGSWFGGDGLHVNHQGALAFARLVRRRIAPIVDPPVRALRLPRSVADAKRCGVVRRSRRSLRVRVVRGDEIVTCRRARQLARRSALRPPQGWRAYDLSQVRRGRWNDAYVRRDRRVVVATAPRR